ncbi:MAG: AAA family ATPase [Nocardioidaceae bacterium]
MNVFVLVGGWPAAGKTTVARPLASELGIAYLSKDEVKEALMDRLGPPRTVEESRELGTAAVTAVLRTAQGCPGAVIDSTWFPYSLPLVRDLPGPFVEIRCRLDTDLARDRYRRRARDPRHLDALRTESELWGTEVAPLGVGPLVEVSTAEPVDVVALANHIRSMVTRSAPSAAGDDRGWRRAGQPLLRGLPARLAPLRRTRKR